MAEPVKLPHPVQVKIHRLGGGHPPGQKVRFERLHAVNFSKYCAAGTATGNQAVTPCFGTGCTGLCACLPCLVCMGVQQIDTGRGTGRAPSALDFICRLGGGGRLIRPGRWPNAIAWLVFGSLHYALTTHIRTGRRRQAFWSWMAALCVGAMSGRWPAGRIARFRLANRRGRDQY